MKLVWYFGIINGLEQICLLHPPCFIEFVNTSQQHIKRLGLERHRKSFVLPKSL